MMPQNLGVPVCAWFVYKQGWYFVFRESDLQYMLVYDLIPMELLK